MCIFFFITSPFIKEFIDNAVTCIDVHPHRSKYVVIGFQKGQISLVDLTEMKKNLKLIKDHHKKAGTDQMQM
jgi:hypothetical protein